MSASFDAIVKIGMAARVAWRKNEKKQFDSRLLYIGVEIGIFHAAP
jgi:hypothetical protein